MADKSWVKEILYPLKESRRLEKLSLMLLLKEEYSNVVPQKENKKNLYSPQNLQRIISMMKYKKH